MSLSMIFAIYLFSFWGCVHTPSARTDAAAEQPKPFDESLIPAWVGTYKGQGSVYHLDTGSPYARDYKKGWNEGLTTRVYIRHEGGRSLRFTVSAAPPVEHNDGKGFILEEGVEITGGDRIMGKEYRVGDIRCIYALDKEGTELSGDIECKWGQQQTMGFKFHKLEKVSAVPEWWPPGY